MPDRPTKHDVGRVVRTQGRSAVWGWAKGHGPYRWRLALEYAEDKVRQIRKKPRDAQGNLERWQTAAHVYGKKLAAVRAHHKQHGGQPEFKKAYLNGHPGNVVSAVKREIARAVVIDGAYVTATTDGTHATGSYHYPANNPDPVTRAQNLGRAADHGGTSAQYLGHFEHEKARGVQLYMELFGPAVGYIKNGTWYTGASPDVPNHCHCAPALNA